jgi:hypothetical protein
VLPCLAFSGEMAGLTMMFLVLASRVAQSNSLFLNLIFPFMILLDQVHFFFLFLSSTANSFSCFQASLLLTLFLLYSVRMWFLILKGSDVSNMPLTARPGVLLCHTKSPALCRQLPSGGIHMDILYFLKFTYPT